MKIKNFKQSSKAELLNLLKEKRGDLQSFYFKITKGRVKNVKEARELKKDIARILTILKNTN